MNKALKTTQKTPSVTSSLSKKISRLVLLAALTLGVLSCLGYFYYAYSIYKKNLYNIIRQEISSTNQSAALAAYTVDNIMAQHLLNGIIHSTEIAYAQIILEDGLSLAQAGSPPKEYYFVTRMLFPTLENFYERLNFKTENISFDTGELIIYPDYDSYTGEILAQLRMSLLYISLLSLLLFILIRRMVNNELSSPITSLSQQLAAIKNDPLPIYLHRLIKPAKHNDDEIGYLIDNFNSLFEHLKKTETMASNIKDTLATTEIQYSAMVKNTFEMFMRLDEKARIQFCNPAVKDILQFSLEEIIGTNLVSYIDNADKKLFQSIFSDVVSGRAENITLILHCITKNSEERILSCTITNALAIDKLQCILFVAHDITKSHHTENELRQSQKIESIGKLTGGIAHDFNNILTIIINNIELAQSTLKKSDFPQIGPVNNYLESALNAGFSGADLTSRLLAFARNQPLNPLVFNPNDQIKNILLLLQNAISDNITITDDLAMNIGCIKIDKSQFDNAILNLCINSQDAISPQRKGGIHITTTRTNIYPRPNGTLQKTEQDYIRIDIADNGGGINPKNLKKVIDPFFTTKPMGKGTGLGLSMAHGFVHQSKGHFNIESKEGVGTTIQLYFPAYGSRDYDANEGNKIKPCLSEQDFNGTGLTVLVLEDNITIADIIEKLLQDMGFRVIKTHKTADAFIAFNSEKIDLTLSDVLLPDDISGFAFADKIKEEHPEAKIVHMSGYTDPESLLGDTQYSIGLRKPFRKRDLVHIIQEVLYDK